MYTLEQTKQIINANPYTCTITNSHIECLEEILDSTDNTRKFKITSKLNTEDYPCDCMDYYITELPPHQNMQAHNKKQDPNLIKPKKGDNMYIISIKQYDKTTRTYYYKQLDLNYIKDKIITQALIIYMKEHNQTIYNLETTYNNKKHLFRNLKDITEKYNNMNKEQQRKLIAPKIIQAYQEYQIQLEEYKEKQNQLRAKQNYNRLQQLAQAEEQANKYFQAKEQIQQEQLIKIITDLQNKVPKALQYFRQLTEQQQETLINRIDNYLHQPDITLIGNAELLETVSYKGGK